MKHHYSILALGLLFAVACDPIDTPTSPDDSTMAGGDSISVDNDTTIILPDDPVVADSLGVAAMDIVFNVADETAYGEAKEEIVDNNQLDAYGDFIENFTKSPTTVTITFSEGGASWGAVPSGMSIKRTNAHVEITSEQSGVQYLLKGSTSNGSFKLSSEKKSLITLGGASITNPTGAAINIQSGKTVLVQLANGTTNTLEGSSVESSGDEQQKGAFFSEGQLIFSGGGSLTVKGNAGHGIASDDYVRIREGVIDIHSADDGIKAKDCFIMYGGTVNVVAQGDGLDVGEGYIEIGGGHLTVNAVDEGVTASYEGGSSGGIDPRIDIRGGFIKVATTGDKGHALRAMSTLSMSGGSIVQAFTRGAGSKALLSEGDMSLVNSKVTAITEGDALYEAKDGELSSSAALRSKGKLTLRNMVVGLKSTGAGSKGINNVGDVVLEDTKLKVVATGEDYIYGDKSARPYGITTDGTFSASGDTLLIKTTRMPIKAASEQIADDVVYVSVTLEE